MDFSMIIPACGRQDRIAACLRSVTRCPKENIDMECIVVNDSSEDETAAIVKRYMERDGRIRIVTDENGSMAGARNKGIEEAKGRYIMFLDADDRLCEDAWEHIEAAVEEEYADFVVFSHIIVSRSGRLKACMLPIPDRISADEREAAGLLYADSVFYICRGKIFRSDIVKENHITFRTDLKAGTDFLFAAEYFEHCESCMLTKAMIFYMPQGDSLAAQGCSMEDRLQSLKILYGVCIDAAERRSDMELKKAVQAYYPEVVVNLFSEYAREGRRRKEPLETLCERVLQDETVKNILNAADENSIHTKRKRREYRILKSGNVKKICRHYSWKAKWKSGAVFFAMAMLLAGCGKKTDNTNLLAGMELVEQYDFEGAMESFDLALLNNEDLELSYRGQGLAYMGLGNYAEAESAFLKSIENAENKLTELEYDTNYYLASAYMKQGKYAEAEEIYSAILSLKKKETDAFYLRACARLRQNRYDEAVQDFEKAFALDSDNLDIVTDAYVEMQEAGFSQEGKAYIQEFMQEKDKSLKDGEKGIIYYYLEDYENARIYLDSFVNGNDPELSLILGQTYEKLGDMNYAVVVYQTYLDANSPNAALYNSLGVCLMNQQKYSEALEAFESGIAMGNSDYLQELSFNRIVANEYLGNFSGAKSMIQEYLQTYPDDARAKKESEFLSTR
ncbi:MAG: glycosyltransferase [Lachnospiraceae bacterium]|nr:glycosyltransferase [Lachnospiraceae bacterium]